jgi:hypothetical protein
MTDLLYEKQGSYQQGKEDVAKAMLIEGDSVEKIVRVTKISKDRILELQAIVSKADG